MPNEIGILPDARDLIQFQSQQKVLKPKLIAHLSSLALIIAQLKLAQSNKSDCLVEGVLLDKEHPSSKIILNSVEITLKQ